MSYSSKPVYLAESKGYNQRLLLRYRSLVAVICGIVSGIFGFSGMNGFLMFGVYSVVGTGIFVLKLGSSLKLYYTGISEVWGTWTSGFMEYLLFWIITYNIIYILT